MLLWLSDTLGTAAHTVKLLTVSLRSTVFRNVGWVGSICCWVGLVQQIWTQRMQWGRLSSKSRRVTRHFGHSSRSSVMHLCTSRCSKKVKRSKVKVMRHKKHYRCGSEHSYECWRLQLTILLRRTQGYIPHILGDILGRDNLKKTSESAKSGYTK